MRRRLLITAVLCCLANQALSAQNAVDLYQQALSQERAFGNLEQAIQLFERAAKEAGNDRTLAAKALMGEARAYENLSPAKSVAKYEELIRTFPDQREQVGASNLRLAAIPRSSENYDFESGVLGQRPLLWGGGSSVAGFKIELTEKGCLEGFRCVRLTGVPNPPANWFGTINHSVNPLPYLGKVVHFRAAVRVEGAGTRAQMWLRCDRAGGGVSCFDNMDKRPITSDEWAHYSIDAIVTPDTNGLIFGVMIFGSGQVWVDDVHFDSGSERASSLIRYSPDAFSPPPKNGASAVSQAIGRPWSVAIDERGNVYSSSLAYGQVYEVAFDGTIKTVVGTGMNGFNGDAVPAISTQLSSPRQVTVDSIGNLYVADASNNRVRKISPAGVISTVAGNGTQGFSGDGGAATSAALADPMGVVSDRFGNLFIADSRNSRIRKVSSDGRISSIAGTGIEGHSGDGGPAISADIHPFGLALDAAGNLFIAEAINHRVRKITPEGLISTVAGNGTAGFSGDGGPALSAQLNDPLAVAVDAAGNLFIADTSNNRIRKVTPDGVISTVAGNGQPYFRGDGGPATAAGLGAMSVAVDKAGNLFIADLNNSRIRKVTPDGRISTIAGNGIQP